jgi:hypothetical protein
MPRWVPIVAVFALCSAASVSAATMNTTGQFYTDVWSTGATIINGDQSHFFDGPSADSVTQPNRGCNIGYYLTGTGAGCNNQPGNVNRFSGSGYNGPGRSQEGLPSLGDTSTTNNLDFSFQPQSATFTVQLMAEASPNHASNALGVYTKDPAGNVAATLILFAGTDTPGKTIQFTPGSSNWGFFFATGAGSYYTDRLFGSDTTMQHFAVFRDAADVTTGLNFRKLWIGVEESPFPGSFADYNDMIFTLSCNECGSSTGGQLAATPEPDTFTTFATGAALIGAAMLLGRLRASGLQSATLRRSSDADHYDQEPHSRCLYADGRSSTRMAAGLGEAPAAVCDAVRQ